MQWTLASAAATPSSQEPASVTLIPRAVSSFASARTLRAAMLVPSANSLSTISTSRTSGPNPVRGFISASECNRSHYQRSADQEKGDTGNPRFADRVARPPIASEKQQGDQHRIRDAQREACIVDQQERDGRWQAGDHDQEEADEGAEPVIARDRVLLFCLACDVVDDALVQRFRFPRTQQSAEQRIQFLADQGDGVAPVLRAPDGESQPLQPAAIEQLADEIQRGIDDAPRDVAADHGDEQLARAGAALVFDDQAGAECERQRHDQAEQDLGERRGRVQVPMQHRHAIGRGREGNLLRERRRLSFTGIHESDENTNYAARQHASRGCALLHLTPRRCFPATRARAGTLNASASARAAYCANAPVCALTAVLTRGVLMAGNNEADRLRRAREGSEQWRHWGPYLSERQWG